MAVRDHDLVVCDGEWDISRADELASLVTEALARGAGIAAPRLPPGDVRRCEHGRGDLRSRREASQRGVERRRRLRARDSCDGSSSSLASRRRAGRPRRGDACRGDRAERRPHLRARDFAERMARAGGRPGRMETIMRNTWKGMMLGALGGAAVGLVLESIDRAARGASTAVHATPDVAARAGGRARCAPSRSRTTAPDSPRAPHSARPTGPPSGTASHTSG